MSKYVGMVTVRDNHLRDRAGMTYGEIAQMDIFADLGMNSLGTLYQRNRKRLQTGKNDPK